MFRLGLRRLRHAPQQKRDSLGGCSIKQRRDHLSGFSPSMVSRTQSPSPNTPMRRILFVAGLLSAYPLRAQPPAAPSAHPPPAPNPIRRRPPFCLSAARTAARRLAGNLGTLALRGSAEAP